MRTHKAHSSGDAEIDRVFHMTMRPVALRPRLGAGVGFIMIDVLCDVAIAVKLSELDGCVMCLRFHSVRETAGLENHV